jgi:hypothetical protein
VWDESHNSPWYTDTHKKLGKEMAEHNEKFRGLPEMYPEHWTPAQVEEG